jgi:4-hydroxy-tetrahydrodipicolinate synthase
MFRGLSAFPPTPTTPDGRLDEPGLARIVERLCAAGVDSIGALGSTGGYAYLSREERDRVTRIVVEHAGATPVVVGVGALRTRDVLDLVADAQERGAAGVLVSAMTYQQLDDREVLGLFEDVAAVARVPIVVYDNPGTTHVHYSDELHARIAALPGVASIKIPPVPLDRDRATARISALRARLPADVTIGISGDAAGAIGLLGGCDAWYSAVAGVLPAPCVAIARAAQTGDDAGALALSGALQPVWELLARYGSYRVVAALAEALGLAADGGLPRPVRGLDAEGRSAVRAALERIEA